MRVANREQVPGGWMVDLEIPGAFRRWVNHERRKGLVR